jgi:hypothetical protein
MKRTRISGHHAPKGKRSLPWALRPNEELSLPKIAGMAHSTLKSEAATHDGVASDMC